MAPNELKTKYEKVLPSVKSIKEGVSSVISEYCEVNHLAVVSRIKSLKSLADKIETGRFKKFEDIDDIVGFMIIVPTLNSIPSTIEFLNSSFEIVSLKKRGGAFKPPELFRFDSTRFIGKLKNQNDTNPEKLEYNLSFEIQIRTAFEYAWSIATHDLTYKTDNLSWKRLRLTSQIKASVEQLDMLISGFENITEHITESKDQILSVQIAVTDLFIKKFEEGSIPDVIRPQNLNRFSESIIKLLHHSEKVVSTDYRKIRKSIIKLLNLILDNLERKTFPISITLYQSILGELLMLEPTIFENSKISLFVTNNAISLYPELGSIPNKFDLEEE